jgi:hypothetical protein
MLNLRTLALGGVIAGLGLSLTACSSLTRPDEITVVAEPLPSPNAPPKVAAADEGPDQEAGRRALPGVARAAAGAG